MSLSLWSAFFGQHGFNVVNVERHEIHGKSIRVFIARKGERIVQAAVAALLQLEEDTGIYRKEILGKFARRLPTPASPCESSQSAPAGGKTRRGHQRPGERQYDSQLLQDRSGISSIHDGKIGH